MEPLLENIYREDRVQAAKVVGAGKNVSLCYHDNSQGEGSKTIIAEGNKDFMLPKMTVGNPPKMNSYK